MGFQGSSRRLPLFSLESISKKEVQNVPELMRVQEALAKKGLSDPWLRNEVWRYEQKEWGTVKSRWQASLFRGFKYGFAAFLATVVIEKGLEAINPSKDDHHGHH